MKIDPLKITSKIPYAPLGRKLLETFLSVAVPFNFGLSLKVVELSPSRVKLCSPPRWKRKNHLGGAHACALAVLGEVPAGLLVLQKYPMDKYRFILSALTVNYHKQGFGTLYSEAQAPSDWPHLVSEGEIWAEFETKITNESGELIADAKTKWQIKPWTTVKTLDDARG